MDDADNPDQSNTCSAMKLSRQELLVESRFAERCDRLMAILTPASFAAWMKFTVAWMRPGCTGQTK